MDGERSIVGKTLNHYEILEPLGTGGMGEVYRARDTTLEREVAIKLLPDDLAADPDRLGRFEREAKLLASLNHANIGVIHGFEESDGVHFLVLELIEGQTLEQRLGQGAIPVSEALDIARQIAEALEAAHGAGVIHRDVKPANVLLTAKGAVKVLDFGIAKSAVLGDDADTALTRQATSLTVDGTLIGTPPYMAPEQVRGEEADKRADIWAFGCIVYEMLAGARAFGRETVADTLVAVLEQKPDWSRLPSDTPRLVQSVLRRCLRKDPHRRLHDVADARIELDEALAEPTTTRVRAAESGQPAGGSRVFPTIAALALGALLTAIVAWTLWPNPPPRSGPPGRFDIELADGWSLFYLTGERTWGGNLAISSDGRQLAYVAEESVRRLGRAERALYVRPLAGIGARRIEGIPDGATDPFFSPDGDMIGYYHRGSGELQYVSLDGGQPTTIAEVSESFLGASWSGDNIFYGEPEGIFRAPADGDDEPLPVITARDGEQLYGPQLLPDGESILLTAKSGDETWDQARIVIGEIDSDIRIDLDLVGHDAGYVPTGHLLYARNGDLWAVAFDVVERAVTGEPIVVERGLQVGGVVAQYAVSDLGTLIYARPEPRLRTLEWVNRDGVPEPIGAEPDEYLFPRVSPDGGRLVLQVGHQNEGSDLAILDLEPLNSRWLTRRPRADDSTPVWLNSGERVLYAATDDDISRNSLYLKATDRNEDPVRLTDDTFSGEFSQFVMPDDSRAGFRRDVPRESGDGLKYDLFMISLTPVDGKYVEEPLLTGDDDIVNADVSPDGQYLAYESNREGQYEIFIAPMNDPRSFRKVSQGGGAKPVWSRSGEELFYVTETNPPWLMSVPMDMTGTQLDPGEAVPLFDVSDYYLGNLTRNYDVDPEGRFAFIRAPDPPGIQVWVNWFGRLEQLLATER